MLDSIQDLSFQGRGMKEWNYEILGLEFRVGGPARFSKHAYNPSKPE